MKHLITLLISLAGAPAFAELGSLDGLYRIERTCTDGTKPNDLLVEGSLYITFAADARASIYAGVHRPEANGYCVERSQGTYEVKDDSVRVRVTKREHLGDCDSFSDEQPTNEEPGDFITLERTERGFRAVSGTEFEDGGSCKRGVQMGLELVRVHPPEPVPPHVDPAPPLADPPAPPEPPQPEVPAGI